MEIGLEIVSFDDAESLISIAKSCSFDFGVSQILTLNSEFLLEKAPAAFSESDLIIRNVGNTSFDLELARFVKCGEISQWTDFENEDNFIRINSELLFRKQIDWVSHTGLESVLFPLISASKLINYARLVRDSLDYLDYTVPMIRVKCSDWKSWNKIRTMCDFSPKLKVALDLDANFDSWTLGRWISEPISMLIVPARIFLSNKGGFPVLPKPYQQFMFKIMKMCSKFVISLDTFDEQEKNLVYYREYLLHLHNNQPKESVIDKFATGYQDYLQMPLQPLMDNLHSQTYEVFESDPVKYDQYETAISQALLERHFSGELVVIMVVGAGRGPLVDRALKASKSTNRNLKIYALEKNSNAIVNLHTRNEKEWGGSVKVIHCDMRFWAFSEKCDILVSELLGSMGDNELSPECLDGIQHVLKASGISIPSSYKSFISPISSTSLLTKCQSLEAGKCSQIPYVVKFRDIFPIADPVEIWEFIHPNNTAPMNPLGHPDFNCHNTRFTSKTFMIQDDCLLHGFAAYFESVLYKDTLISILPSTHSPNMTSWFPMFFPSKVL